jgi:lipopolysaccharide export system protein LptA
MTRFTLLLAFPLALAAVNAAAERGDREKEIVVGADRLTADDANRTSTFEGNVVVTHGTMRMTAGKVVVREDAQRNKLYI